MTMDRERTSDELIEESTKTRARLAEVTRQLCWFVNELERELDQEPDDRRG